MSGSAGLVQRIEDGPLWWLGRLLIPNKSRRRVCQARGLHRPELVNFGMEKSCPYCGTW